MKPNTYSAVKAIIEADETIPDDERAMILDACRSPVPRHAAERFSRLMPVGEAASLLSVHPRTVWRLIRSRCIRSVKVGCSRRIRTDDLALFVGRGAAPDSAGSTVTAAVRTNQAS